MEPFIDAYMKSFDRYGQANFIGFRPIPSMGEIESIIEDILELLFPGRSGTLMTDESTLRTMLCTSMV